MKTFRTKKSKHRPIRKPPGTAPGSMIFTGKKKLEETTIIHTLYSEADLKFLTIQPGDTPQPEKEFKNWIDVRGLHNTEFLSRLGKQFGIHSLAMEDIVNVHQRPKLEYFENGNFIALKALTFSEEQGLGKQQVCLFYNEDYLISFQEEEDDLFAPIRERLKKKDSRIRKSSPEYLVYAIMDMFCDQYFIINDKVEEEIDQIEQRVIEFRDKELKVDIYFLRNIVVEFRRIVVPMRDIASRFVKMDTSSEEGVHVLYFRDLYDHIIHLLDAVESARESVHSLAELYNTQLGLMNNSIIQTLTIISTIFIPITFIAGVYGMNFVWMPELEWEYGYFISLGLMIIVVLAMLNYFRRKNWF
jgi:magnesium transporter